MYNAASLIYPLLLGKIGKEDAEKEYTDKLLPIINVYVPST